MKNEEEKNKQPVVKHTCKICKKSFPLERCLEHRLETGHSNFDPYCSLVKIEEN